MNESFVKRLGNPDIHLHGLRIWVHGLQFPDRNDYWDADWLQVSVYCSAIGSSVFVSGPIIHLSELKTWTLAAMEMFRTLTGEANLECMEPELRVRLKAQSLGRIDMQVEISPDCLMQEHKYYFEIDQSYLPNLITECSNILAAFPLKDVRRS